MLPDNQIDLVISSLHHLEYRIDLLLRNFLLCIKSSNLDINDISVNDIYHLIQSIDHLKSFSKL